MTLHDARLPAWSITGTTGGTIVLRCPAVPEALADSTVSLWLGGTAGPVGTATYDVDDLAGAIEIPAEAVGGADGDDWTWTISVPTGRDPVALRWTVDGVPATVGALIPSRVGALVLTRLDAVVDGDDVQLVSEVRLAVDDVRVELTVSGVADLVDQLEQAVKSLSAEQRRHPLAQARLEGKAEGVRLALAIVREASRG